MTDRELSLLEKLVEAQRELTNALTAVAEANLTIAQALLPEVSIVKGEAEDGPQTLQ